MSYRIFVWNWNEILETRDKTELHIQVQNWKALFTCIYLCIQVIYFRLLSQRSGPIFNACNLMSLISRKTHWLVLKMQYISYSRFHSTYDYIFKQLWLSLSLVSVRALSYIIFLLLSWPRLGSRDPLNKISPPKNVSVIIPTPRCGRSGFLRRHFG